MSTRAQKMRVTVSSVEEQDGEDYTIKVKVREEKLDDIRPLAESTISHYAVGKQSWVTEHRKRARQNAANGRVMSYSYDYYVGIGKEDHEPKGKAKGHHKDDDIVTPPVPIDPPDMDPIPGPVAPDAELNLAQLREKYPEIKATSKEAFLTKVAESKS